MKVREEVETVVGDGEVLLRVFKELGLEVWFRYEKYREEFSHEDVTIAVDETPFGVSAGDRRQRAGHRSDGGGPGPHTVGLHRRLVSRTVPPAARDPRPDRRRHGVRRPRMSAPRALVLTAGLGTRLRPLTYLRAKAAVPVNGETLARRAVRWLASQGITDLVLNLHHHPRRITASVGDGADSGAPAHGIHGSSPYWVRRRSASCPAASGRSSGRSAPRLPRRAAALAGLAVARPRRHTERRRASPESWSRGQIRHHQRRHHHGR